MTGAATAPGAAPRVSVVIIFLDPGRYLAEAIESVRAQTFAAWELLLVDDGSSDGSSELARGYAAREPERVRYLEHPGHANLGTSATRNLGIAHARGELVAFLDADDVWLPERLERAVAEFARWPEAGMIYCQALHWFSWTGAEPDQRRDWLPPDFGVPFDTPIAPPRLLRLFLENDDRTPTPSAAVIRRDLLTEVGGFEPSFRGMFEDQVVYAKLCARAVVVASSGCWLRYRKHPDSMYTQAVREGRVRATRRVYLEWAQGHFRRTGFRDREVLRLLRRQLWPLRHPTLHRVWTRGRRALRAVARRAGVPRALGRAPAAGT